MCTSLTEITINAALFNHPEISLVVTLDAIRSARTCVYYSEKLEGGVGAVLTRVTKEDDVSVKRIRDR